MEAGLETVLELYDLEIHQKKLGPDYHRLKTMVKRSIEQEIRNKNFGARSGNFEKNAVVKNQGTKQRVQRILGDCWQWETNGQCVIGDNCSFRHDINKRGKVTPSNPSPNSFMQQNERKSSRTQSPRGKSPSGRMSRWPCKDYPKGTRNNSERHQTSHHMECGLSRHIFSSIGLRQNGRQGQVVKRSRDTSSHHLASSLNVPTKHVSHTTIPPMLFPPYHPTSS